MYVCGNKSLTSKVGNPIPSFSKLKKKGSFCLVLNEIKLLQMLGRFGVQNNQRLFLLIFAAVELHNQVLKCLFQKIQKRKRFAGSKIFSYGRLRQKKANMEIYSRIGKQDQGLFLQKNLKLEFFIQRIQKHDVMVVRLAFKMPCFFATIANYIDVKSLI